jgi:hypothetical protein
MKFREISMAVGAMAIVLLANTAGAAIFELDRLTIVKNGNPMFDDPFDDDPALPAAPPFSGGNAAEYFIDGSVGKTGGKLQFDTDGGDLVTGSSGILFKRSRATLRTNVSNSSDPDVLRLGLKDDDTFVVTGLFDLDAPLLKNESFELRLNDGTSTNPTNSILSMRLLRASNDYLYITEYFDPDGSGPGFNLLSYSGVDLTNEQIAFRFTKAAADSKYVDTAWAYVNGSVFGDWTNGVGAALFSDERFTRVQAQAWSPVPLPAAAWLFVGALGLLGMTARRRT